NNSSICPGRVPRDASGGFMRFACTFAQECRPALPIQRLLSRAKTCVFGLITRAVLLSGLFFPVAAFAQGNYVYVNNQSTANSVEAYSVAANGTLTPLSSS